MDEVQRQRILALLERQCAELDRLIDRLDHAISAYSPAAIDDWEGMASLAFEALRGQLRSELDRAGERLRTAKLHSRRAVLTLSGHVG